LDNILIQASGKRPGARGKVPPVTKPKPKGSDSELSGELFAKLRRRKERQGEGEESF